MATLKLTKTEKILSLGTGITAGLLLFILVRDPVMRLVFSTALLFLVAVLSLIPVFKMSYTFTYSTDKPVEEVMDDVNGEDQLLAKVVRERGVENVETNGDELSYEVSTSFIHEKLGRTRKVRIEIEEKEDNKVEADEYLNGELIGRSTTKAREEGDRVVVEETYQKEGRANAATLFGLRMEKKTVKKVLERNGYRLEDSSMELGI